MPLFIECVENDITLDEICNTLRGVPAPVLREAPCGLGVGRVCRGGVLGRDEMDDLTRELEREFQLITIRLDAAKKRLFEFSHQNLDSIRTRAVVYCLKRAIDIAEGGTTLARNHLFTSSMILARGLLEILFLVCWVIQSEENAQGLQVSINSQFKTALKEILRKGYGKVSDKVSGNDRTDEYLESPDMTKIPKRLRYEQIAREVGLEKIYSETYRYFSLEAHFGTFEIQDEVVAEDEILTILGSIKTSLDAIIVVSANWAINQRSTPTSDIIGILGL